MAATEERVSRLEWITEQLTQRLDTVHQDLLALRAEMRQESGPPLLGNTLRHPLDRGADGGAVGYHLAAVIGALLAR